MARFDVVPAIDLRGGRVVRLRQGDFARETAYSDDPVAVASAFVDRGARWLHVVDLDGARTGRPAHREVIGRIAAAAGTGASVEVAGGLRSLEAVAEVLAAGAARAVVGTAALADPALVGAMIDRHGTEAIAVAIDVRDGSAIGAGWATGAAGVPVSEAIAQLVGAGVRLFEVTAIDRDGTLDGPDLALLQQAVERASGCRVIASGGIRSVEDVLATWATGCAGAIIGRALYEGSFDLERAVRATSAVE